ncbi:hypothetical protein ABFX02_04G081800 [Erythranthe guttata]
MKYSNHLAIITVFMLMQLLLITVSSQSNIREGVKVEGRMIYYKSKTFRGDCSDNEKCRLTCRRDGFISGTCKHNSNLGCYCCKIRKI